MRTTLRLLILLFITLVVANPSRADRPRLVSSPEHPLTFAYGEMIWHQLFVDPDTGTLAARITFSNLPYADSAEPRQNEAFNFHFPDTRIDRVTGTVFLRDRDHRNRIQIPVATFHGDPTNGYGDLTAGTKIYLIKNSGRLTVLLTATAKPRSGMRWIQMDDNWSLRNLFASLCDR
jgi:hypothetical protein